MKIYVHTLKKKYQPHERKNSQTKLMHDANNTNRVQFNLTLEIQVRYRNYLYFRIICELFRYLGISWQVVFVIFSSVSNPSHTRCLCPQNIQTPYGQPDLKPRTAVTPCARQLTQRPTFSSVGRGDAVFHALTPYISNRLPISPPHNHPKKSLLVFLAPTLTQGTRLKDERLMETWSSATEFLSSICLALYGGMSCLAPYNLLEDEEERKKKRGIEQALIWEKFHGGYEKD